MIKQEFNDWLLERLQSIVATNKKGSAEYAHASNDPFDNFKRTANDLGIAPEMVNWIFLKKHLDGISSYLKGHRSQREHISRRFLDVHVYLFLLEAMILESEKVQGDKAVEKYLPGGM